MKVLFDNCLPPQFASTLHGFISFEGHQAIHIKDVPGLPNGRHSSDIEWIQHLQQDPDDWIFFSGDARILRNKAERAALRSAQLHGFILGAAYQKTPANQVAAALVWKWPEVKLVTTLMARPSMHEFPIGKLGKLKPLPL